LEINEKLNRFWSPEQISQSNRTKGKPFVSFKTIYRWLYERRLVYGHLHVLRHKGKRRKPLETRGKFLIGTSISKLPKAVRKRKTFGHWELDTVVSSRGKSKACVATFLERKTRLYAAVEMPDRTAHSMEIAFGVVASQFPIGTFQSETTDRGKEFACFAALENYHNVNVYFADPNSSWKRGSNENSNGLLREFSPERS